MRSLRRQIGGVDGSMFEGVFTALIVFGIVIGLIGGFILYIAIPALWNWLKPWLHTITA